MNQYDKRRMIAYRLHHCKPECFFKAVRLVRKRIYNKYIVKTTSRVRVLRRRLSVYTFMLLRVTSAFPLKKSLTSRKKNTRLCKRHQIVFLCSKGTQKNIADSAHTLLQWPFRNMFISSAEISGYRFRTCSPINNVPVSAYAKGKDRIRMEAGWYILSLLFPASTSTIAKISGKPAKKANDSSFSKKVKNELSILI